MLDSQTIYPAIIAGYFSDASAAEVASAELQRLDTGPLDIHFDRINILRGQGDVPAETPGAAEPAWLTRLFGRYRQKAAIVVPSASTFVVMTRGSADLLKSLVEPVLRSHGAYEIKHYASWNPGDAGERTAVGSRQKSLKQLMTNAGMQKV